MRLDEYADCDAISLAKLVQEKKVGASDPLHLAVKAAKYLNPELNAICDWFIEEALTDIENLNYNEVFAGVPFLIKDLILQMRGRSCTQGSLLAKHPIASSDSELMSRFRKAGLITFGKNTTPALGAHITTESLLTGDTRNPWNTNYSPGGSSGGAAVAVASGIVPVAHANDALGSIRIPASACHVYGLKPTAQRTPTGPHYGHIAGGRGVEFIISRSVRDSAQMLDLTHGPDAGAPHQAPPPFRPYLDAIYQPPKSLRIAFMNCTFSGRSIAKDCRSAVEKMAQICIELGHNVCEHRPKFEWEEYLNGLQTIFVSRAYAAIITASQSNNIRPSEKTLEDHLFAIYEKGAKYSAMDIIVAEGILSKVQRQIGTFFTEFDILLTPVLSLPPARIGEFKRHGMNFDSYWHTFAGDSYSPFTGIFNVTGQPAASIPTMINKDNLPIGVQAVAPYGREDLLLAISAQIEEASPWAHQHPPIYTGCISS